MYNIYLNSNNSGVYRMIYNIVNSYEPFNFNDLHVIQYDGLYNDVKSNNTKLYNIVNYVITCVNDGDYRAVRDHDKLRYDLDGLAMSCIIAVASYLGTKKTIFSSFITFSNPMEDGNIQVYVNYDYFKDWCQKYIRWYKMRSLFNLTEEDV